MKIRRNYNVIIKFDEKSYSEEEKVKIMYEYFALLANSRAKEIFNKKSITQQEREELEVLAEIQKINDKLNSKRTVGL